MKMLRSLGAIWVVSSLALGIPGTVHAEAAAGANQTLEQRIAELEKQVQLLKRLKEVDQEVQIKKDSSTPIVSASQDGFGFKSPDSNFIIKFRGQAQADGRYYLNDDTAAGSNTYLIRRLRPTLEGTVYKYFDYRLMPDFGGGNTVLQDAWVDFKYWPQASVRFGKFKSPIGLERLQSDPVAMFIESGLSTNLVPNRDTGVDLHGDLFDSALSYDLGVFNGAVDGVNLDTNDTHDDKDAVARIFALPFKNSTHDALNGLGVGVGGSFGNGHGTGSLPSYKSSGQQTFFTYAPASGTDFADGRRVRIAPQAYYYYGPFGFLSEYVATSQQVSKGTAKGKINNKGWQIAASYVLTGENNDYKGITPARPFDPKKGQWGALELVSRVSFLDVDKDAFPVYANPLTAAKGAREWAVGLNWHLNKNIKFMVDFDETYYHLGSNIGGDRKTEHALLSRVQFYI